MAPDNGDSSMSHHCCDSGALPTLVGYLAETRSTSCGGGSTGVETIAGPCRGSGCMLCASQMGCYRKHVVN